MRHGYCVADGARLSNSCHGFNYPSGTFIPKMESLRKRKKVRRFGGAEGENVMTVSVKI